MLWKMYNGKFEVVSVVIESRRNMTIDVKFEANVMKCSICSYFGCSKSLTYINGIPLAKLGCLIDKALSTNSRGEQFVPMEMPLIY